MTESTKFAKAQGIQAESPALRTCHVPCQAYENAVDEPITDHNECFRIQVFKVCLDMVITQLMDRFAADKMPLRVQMQYFAPFKLMTEEYVNFMD